MMPLHLGVTLATAGLMAYCFGWTWEEWCERHRIWAMVAGATIGATIAVASAVIQLTW